MQSVASGLKAKDISLRGNKSFILRKGVCQNWHTFFYAQGPDFHKLGLCYYLKIMYL